jgi:hypothetical protein
MLEVRRRDFQKLLAEKDTKKRGRDRKCRKARLLLAGWRARNDPICCTLSPANAKLSQPRRHEVSENEREDERRIEK